ncbi:MAG: hypothetical protein H6567_06480 [Lewinellaceae bacterium]|nr:hypothetical protein [Lewinellaceae bacterium]
MKIKQLTSIYFFAISLILLLTSGCKPEICCVDIDVNVGILYKNKNGENLINSSSDFKESNIKIYYKNKDNFEYVYNSNLDAPNMHSVQTDPSGNLILIVSPSNYYDGNTSTTLVALNPTTVDTLFCEFTLTENQQICKKAWLNGVEMENRFIEVEK